MMTSLSRPSEGVKTLVSLPREIERNAVGEAFNSTQPTSRTGVCARRSVGSEIGPNGRTDGRDCPPIAGRGLMTAAARALCRPGMRTTIIRRSTVAAFARQALLGHPGPISRRPGTELRGRRLPRLRVTGRASSDTARRDRGHTAVGCRDGHTAPGRTARKGIIRSSYRSFCQGDRPFPHGGDIYRRRGHSVTLSRQSGFYRPAISARRWPAPRRTGAGPAGTDRAFQPRRMPGPPGPSSPGPPGGDSRPRSRVTRERP
jgi:hypothetical protein